jgi:7,8-dihydropterin-6-yl-methyl-4-(beta-D-ribofuranosyl)aminobenzene 5'-phosphate synthase
VKTPSKIHEIALLIFLQIFFTGNITMSQIKNENNNKPEDVNLTIIYDNNPMKNGLQTDWGFACLVEVGKTNLLFDTGDNGGILLGNMAKLNIDPKSVGLVFLSHFHHDHTGGLRDFLKINPKVKVYFPQSFPAEIVEMIRNSGAALIPVSSFKELQTNIFSLGEFGGVIPEQSLAVRTSKGIVVVTGCAHPGIINILEKTKSNFSNELIYLSVGGFHLHRLNNDELKNIIQKIFDMDISTVAPVHCSGNAARKMFEDVFGDGYIDAGVGKTIKIE